ncbi:MAG: IclR family transcriptional regulator [Thermomicrobiales bacterium]|nr:IclR family transcriptional regulator [Thermomicrobiales bacterium]
MEPSKGVLHKAIQVLWALAESEHPLGPTELARLTGIDRSTAHRILAALSSEQMVARVDRNGTYQLGSGLAALGLVAANRLDLRHVARPHLEALHARCDETVNLGLLEKDSILYIDMIESSHGLRMAASIGTRDSLVVTALGKAILAQMPPERRTQMLEQLPLVSRTPYSIQSRDELRAAVETARVQGYALDNQENEIGACCVGAAITGPSGEVIGAVSASLPLIRFAPDRRDEIIGVVVETAQSISRELNLRSA